MDAKKAIETLTHPIFDFSPKYPNIIPMSKKAAQEIANLIADLEAVAEAVREATQHDYITPELWEALSKLDGDQS